MIKLYLIVISMFVVFSIISNLIMPNAFAIFYKEDFQITNVGLNNNHPFIKVQGQAGRSYSTSCGDECYYAYTFVTDRGIFALTVAQDFSGKKPSYGVEQFEINSFKVGECLIEKTALGQPKFMGSVAEYIPKELKFTSISKAYTMQVTLDDPDDNCNSGEHIYKILSSK